MYRNMASTIMYINTGKYDHQFLEIDVYITWLQFQMHWLSKIDCKIEHRMQLWKHQVIANAI